MLADDVKAALAMLGIERLVLSIHQTSFPPGAYDIGAGTPYSDAGAAFLDFVRALGFTGVGLGPGGTTSRIDPSPYDGTWFDLNPLFLDVGALPHGFDAVRAASLDTSRPTPYDDDARARGDDDARTRGGDDARAHDDDDTRTRRDDGAYAHDDDDARARRDGARALGRVEYGRAWDTAHAVAAALSGAGHDVQAILRAQHARMRERAQGLRIYADAQIGVSHVDRLAHPALFLRDYAMGAPPSRTNPEGQPWGYAVFDPALLDVGAPAHAFIARRFEALLSMHDGLRVDHPHGWVCPWVYRTDVDDAHAAVRAGARLFESPTLPDHPALAAYARVTAAQVDPALPRHHDHRVESLAPAQVDAYAAIFDVIVAQAAAFGVARHDLIVEVLSTCPRPLAAVLARHELGRFRVTQKADVLDPHDVYRSDNAAPHDWILVGNHDTPPLRLVVERFSDDERARRANWLTYRLAPRGASAQTRTAMRASLTEPRALAEAMLAELFVGPARNVAIFWADLFGVREIYNRPGVVHPDNWKLRVPRDFAGALERAVLCGEAPSLGRALAMALLATGVDEERAALAARLSSTRAIAPA